MTRNMVNNNESYKYRWILLASCSLLGILTWGSLYSIGVYYVRWIEYFGANKVDVAFVGSLSSGTACILGPLFGAITRRVGIRKAGIAGGLLMTFSYITSAFATNLIYLGVFYGFLFGAAAGLCNYATCVAVNQYFERQRSIAEGIVATGVGLGTFVLILFNQYLINLYDWRGALLIMGAVSGNAVVLCQLLISPSDLKQFTKLKEWKSPRRDSFKVEKCNDISRNNTTLSENSYEIQLSTENMQNSSIHQGGCKSWISECLQLYKNPVFILLLTSDFICFLFIYVPYVHLGERSRIAGIDVDTSAWIISTIGLTGIAGRPFMSALPSLTKINVFYIYGLANILLGILTILSPFLSTKEGLFLYAGAFGFLFVAIPLGKASAADLLGIELFPLAYSWMLLVEGLGIYLGSPLAGWIYDVTLSYDYSFYCMGAGLIISGLLTGLRNTAIRAERAITKSNG